MLAARGRVSTSHTVSHGQSSGKNSIAAKVFGERALKNTSTYFIPWCLIPGMRVPATAVYVFGISRRYFFLRPATRTGTFSALGWDRLPSAVAHSLCAKQNLCWIPGIVVVRMPSTLHCNSCSIVMATFFFVKTRKTISKSRGKNLRK